ncbi:MAG TPA: EAL domain-containing protein [Burkholderiales bacterium]|nr:EAL domain-containing protein [Burkholderiales bacterium]
MSEQIIPHAWPPGNSEMGVAIRHIDWSLTALGPVDAWPASLRTAVSAALDSSWPTIILWGPELIQIYNDAYREILSLRHPAAMGQRTQECWPEVWHFNEPIYRRILSTGECVHFEDQPYVIEPSGYSETRYFTLDYSPARDESGAICGIRVTAMETTRKVLAEREIKTLLNAAQSSVDQLQQIFDEAPSFMALLKGPEHIFEIVNAAYRLLLPDCAVIGKTVAEVVPETECQDFLKQLDAVYATGKPYNATHIPAYLKKSPGAPATRIYLNIAYQPIKDAEGRVFSIFVLGNDVTAQCLAQIELARLNQELTDEVQQVVLAREAARIANERWELAIESSGGGVWDWDIRSDKVLYSARMAEILGYAEDEFDSTLEAWKSRLHPDDRERVLEALQNCLAAIIPSFHAEYRIRNKNGNYIWVASHGIVVERDTDYRAVRATGMMSDITQHKHTEQEQWNQANSDTLTGLPNRRLFRNRLDHAVKTAARSNSILALLFIDLDRFKEANDLLGHDVGDMLLIEAATRISVCVRQTDTVARLGGDEFTVILTNVDVTEHIEHIAQKIIDAIAQPFYLGNEVVYLSASIGITLYSEYANSSEELIKNADQAMYAAKNAGRNRFSYFTRIMQEAAEQRLRLGGDLRHALARNQIEVFYQPVVDLKNGQIVKAEALARWHHPILGMIEPTVFIPIAEETGQIKSIGDWVFKHAADCSKRWGQQLGCVFQIAVNKSPAQFLSHADATAWARHLHGIGLTGSSIVIEITEGLLLHTSPVVAAKLSVFRDCGMQLALDDFGTGYSSMSYLQKFDIDYLKIDQSFVAGITGNEADRAIAESIIVMAHRLGLQVIAEGIETPEQQALLIAAGCDYGQGFLFSQAVPADDFGRILMENMIPA